MRNVSRLFHVGEVSDIELVDIFSLKLGRAQYTSETRVDLPDADAPEVVLHYSGRGKLTRIETSLSDDVLAELLAEVEEKLLVPTEPKFGRSVLFANVPTVGSWDCSWFSLIEAPAEAPRPPYLLGDHPLILEIPFNATPDVFFNLQRHRRLAHEFELLLSLFTTALTPSTSRFSNHLWVYDPTWIEHDPPELQSRWAQAGYTIEGFLPVTDEPMLTASSRIPLVPDNAYFARHGISGGDVLSLPASLAAWLDKYATLEKGLQRRILRSAYWLRHAYSAFTTSHSAALVATIQAVEVLLPNTAGARCAACGQQTGKGPTAKFAEFLETHAPTDASDSSGSSLRKELYGLRSKLTHGHALLDPDEEISLGLSQPRGVHQAQQLRSATRLARLAAIDWFIAQPA